MYRSLSVARGGLNPAVDETASSGIGAGMPSYFLTSFCPVETPADMVVPPVDRALAASVNHREAEKRRRERIKSHLDRLRTLLACDPKTDKASLLAKVVEHVIDLKHRMAEITEARLFPTEADEIIVLPAGSDGRRPVLEATVCCNDRSDLLPELTKTLRSLGMKPLRAEIATLGGRVRNVMVLSRERGDHCMEENDGSFLKDALVALVNRPSGSPDRSKRRRIRDPVLA